VERERAYLRMKEAEKLRQEQEFQEHVHRRAQEHRVAEGLAIQERVARETASREYEVRAQAERLAREAHDKSEEARRRVEE
jgi:hypothetical protein